MGRLELSIRSNLFQFTPLLLIFPPLTIDRRKMMFQDKQGLSAILEVQEGRLGDEKYVRPLRRGQDPEIRCEGLEDEKVLDEKEQITEKSLEKEDKEDKEDKEEKEGKECSKPPPTPQSGFWATIGNTFLSGFAGPPLPGDSIYAFPGPNVGLPLYANFGLDPELAMALWGIDQGRGGRWESARRGPGV
jgi:hypothetical protein